VSISSSNSNQNSSPIATSPKIIPKALPGSVSDPTVATSLTGEFSGVVSASDDIGKDGAAGTTESKLRQRLKSALAKQAIH
jgi:hypothetical protein